MTIKRILARIIYYIFRDNIKAAKVLGVKFGNNCKFIGNPVILFGSEPWAIEIGNHVEITNGVQIITHDGALWTLRERNEFAFADAIKKVVIGDNVFIGVNSVILPGVSIGNNSIIGAGSVVNSDIPNNSVAVGVPARVVKSLDQYATRIISEGFLNTKNLSAKEKQLIWQRSVKNGNH